MTHFINTRSLSIFFSLLAMLFPFICSIIGFYDSPVNSGCMTSLNALYPILVTAGISGLLSLAGLLFGIITYHRIPSPKPGFRKVELFLVSTPLLLLLILIVIFIVVF
jgi:hypothetical protein